MNYSEEFDVMVIGGGHAGTEAALAAARMGASTLLITQNIETLGQMSCNPSIGGIGKGHLVKEIDALGGAMAIATDMAGIQFRILNQSKGPAVRATRAQADRSLYRRAIRMILESQPNLMIFQQSVEDLILEGDRVVGAKTKIGIVFKAKTVVLTAGTFLNGLLHVGLANYSAGRAGDPSSTGLAQRLLELNLPQGRLKTGTPPRIDAKTIDFSKTEIQTGDIDPLPVFSYMGNADMHPKQVNCWITHTSEKTHEIVRSGLDRSPMYSDAGTIEGIGPRYCPSIEDKIHKFAHKTSHQVFLEPEGESSCEIYPNGISTSLPFDIQIAMVHSLPGLENARIMRPGYAIEYDYFDPRSLYPWLETKSIKNLFFAGQINGTTGYEEAAAQGLVAGANAALRVQEKEPWTLNRNQAYIGVLIDDLVTKGVSEPYRMFTSRAEYRLSLREDNADARLTAIGHQLGLVDELRWQSFNEKRSTIENEIDRLNNIKVNPKHLKPTENKTINSLRVDRQPSAIDLLKRPDINYEFLMGLSTLDGNLLMGPGIEKAEYIDQLCIEVKYSGYVNRQKEEIRRQQEQLETIIPENFDYSQVVGLSNEVRQRLELSKPLSIGQASRISGVTPAAISLLLIYLKKNNLGRKAA